MVTEAVPLKKLNVIVLATKCHFNRNEIRRDYNFGENYCNIN